MPGSGFSLSETVPGGWDQTSATCDDGSPVSNINLAAGEVVTCTFSNRKRATLTVVKDAQPNDAQDFTLHRGRRPQPVELLARRRLRRDAVEHPHVREHRARLRLLAVRERARAGGTRSGPAATTAAPWATSRCPPVRQVTCTFTNQKHGNIVVVKNSHAQRPAGLQLHGGRRPQPVELLARRRLQPGIAQHPDLQRANPGSGYSVSRDRAGGLGPDLCDLRRRQPGLERRRVARRDRHVHLPEPQARATSWCKAGRARAVRRTSRSRQAAASARRASCSTSTRIRPIPTPNPSGTWSRAPTRSPRPSPAGGSRPARPAMTAAPSRPSS